MTVTRRGLAGCEHSVLQYISKAPQLLKKDNSVETGHRVRVPGFSLVCRVKGSVCRVYAWLFRNPVEWYLQTQLCVAASSGRVSMSGIGIMLVHLSLYNCTFMTTVTE